MAELPKWVYDLVADLLDEEDTHPKYMVEVFVMAAGKHQLVPHDWCPAKPLARVPEEVKATARVLTWYRAFEPNPEIVGYRRVRTPKGERIAYLPAGEELPGGWTDLGPYPPEPAP